MNETFLSLYALIATSGLILEDGMAALRICRGCTAPIPIYEIPRDRVTTPLRLPFGRAHHDIIPVLPHVHCESRKRDPKHDPLVLTLKRCRSLPKQGWREDSMDSNYYNMDYEISQQDANCSIASILSSLA